MFLPSPPFPPQKRNPVAEINSATGVLFPCFRAVRAKAGTNPQSLDHRRPSGLCIGRPMVSARCCPTFSVSQWPPHGADNTLLHLQQHLMLRTPTGFPYFGACSQRAVFTRNTMQRMKLWFHYIPASSPLSSGKFRVMLLKNTSFALSSQDWNGSNPSGTKPP